MMDLTVSLNPNQKQAVTLIKGPVLVIAGPGSGKTKCLTHRIVYLIKQNIPGYNILAVTFTNKAAQEMKERIIKLMTTVKSAPVIGTFHSVCLRILRQEISRLGYQNNFVIYDEADQLSLLKKIINQLEINIEQFKPNSVQNAISQAKNDLIDFQSYQEKAQDYYPQTIAKIYTVYQNELKKANALDFDDLIMLTVRLFQKEPAILEKYQDKWKYILVDEAHDTNHSQYILTKLLADKYKNIWVIADPDQSIYSWRGADFRNILNFEKDYPDVNIVFLEQNYRSTQTILEASHHIINKNTLRKDKKLWTNNPEGGLINIVETANEEEEGEFIATEIDNLLNDGRDLKDITILYRTNAQSRAIEESLLKAGFPYKIIGAVKFYDRKEIKDILAYLKVIINPNDLISLSRIINTPPRRLAKFSKEPLLTNLRSVLAQEYTSDARESIKPGWKGLTLNSSILSSLQKFNQLIQSFQTQSKKSSLSDLINEIIKQADYEKYIRNGKKEGEKRWENIQELFTVAKKYDSLKPGLGLEKFLEETTLLSSSDEISKQSGLINLMTIHCAKGLEFPVVFIIGCEEGIFPHARSLLDPQQMEEERRLCYVALTRAKEKAYLTFTRQRRIFGQTSANMPSRFIADIPEYLVDFTSTEW